MENDKILIIGRGLNGWHAAGITCHGNRFSSSGGSLDGYAKDACDGALVYDADQADVQSFANLIIKGPMVDPTLDPDAVDSFSDGDRKIALQMAPLLEGGFRTLALLSQDKTLRSLDSVGVGVYEGLLRQIPGIRIGRIKSGVTVWES